MTKIPVFALSATLLLSVADSRAEVRVIDQNRVCRATLPDSLHLNSPSWNGACTSGWFTGKGRLRGGDSTEIEGEFREGKLIEGTGRARVTQADGSHELMRISVNNAQLKAEPLFDLPGRTRVPMRPLLGQWKLESTASCEENLTFQSPDIVTALSGNSRIDSIVHLYSVGTTPEWMEVVSLRLYQNSEADCRGTRLDQSSDVETERYFLRVDEQGKLRRCATGNLKTCSAAAMRRETEVASEGRPAMRVSSAFGFGGGVADAASNPRIGDELVFDRNKGAFYALYGRALRDDPDLEGKVVFEIDIATDGQVTGCRIKSSELNAPELEAKLCERMKRVRFWNRDVPVTIVRPMDFFPAA